MVCQCDASGCACRCDSEECACDVDCLLGCPAGSMKVRESAEEWMRKVSPRVEAMARRIIEAANEKGLIGEVWAEKEE